MLVVYQNQLAEFRIVVTIDSDGQTRIRMSHGVVQHASFQIVSCCLWSVSPGLWFVSRGRKLEPSNNPCRAPNNKHHKFQQTTNMDDNAFESLENALVHHNEWVGQNIKLAVDGSPEVDQLVDADLAECFGKSSHCFKHNMPSEPADKVRCICIWRHATWTFRHFNILTFRHFA
jgi:hypothetical protein